MKKTLILFTILQFSLLVKVKAQGNLQFNQVINLSSNSSYTVPSGKALKIESINQVSSGYGVPYAGNCMINCPSCGGSSGVTCYYNSFVYLTIGSVQFTNPGDFTYVNSGGSCSVCPAFKYFNTTVPTLQLPIWLKAGETVSINMWGVHLSALEFNIVP